MVLLEALLVFTISYVLAYSLGRRLGAQNARWLALAYSTAYTLVLLAPREHKLLLAMLGATAIAATALASTHFHKSHTKEKNQTKKEKQARGGGEERKSERKQQGERERGEGRKNGFGV